MVKTHSTLCGTEHHVLESDLEARMTATDATAEVFWTAFQAPPPEARQAVLARMIQDEGLRCDLLDLACIEERRGDEERPLRAYLAERSRRG